MQRNIPSPREIKFRFWSKLLRQWVIPDDGVFVGALKDPHMAVMQYTGLKDKNGREIYEGDIVSLWGGNQEIKFTYGLFGILTAEPLCNFNSNCKVIGNIYENPDLLPDPPDRVQPDGGAEG